MTNYFVYLPDRRDRGPWECTATSAGYERVSPGSPYPPRRHPVDHHFTWANGRVLPAYQILYITEGKGYFESEVSAQKQTVEAGSVLILFPGVWHRYSPESKTGWVENWIECRGALSIERRRPSCFARNEPCYGLVFCRICCNASNAAMQ